MHYRTLEFGDPVPFPLANRKILSTRKRCFKKTVPANNCHLKVYAMTLPRTHSHRRRWSQCLTHSSRSHCYNCGGPVCVCGDTDHCTGDWCRDASQKTETLTKEEKICPTLTRWGVHSNEISMKNML